VGTDAAVHWRERGGDAGLLHAVRTRCDDQRTDADARGRLQHLGAGTGAFSQLPAGLPIFGQVQKSLPIDAGGGNPGNDYQFVGRVDWTMGPATQAYVRYAYQNAKTDPGTNASSPYNGYDTGNTVNNHNILGSFVHVFSTNITSQTKLVFNQVANDQPINGDPQPTLYMNPTTAVRLQNYRISFPGYLPWSPGNAIPFGGPQRLLQLYHDQTWIMGRHDFRFGGSYVHMTDDRTFGAVRERGRIAEHDLQRADVAGQLRHRSNSPVQTAINPEGFRGARTRHR
jgi:hypothetical protein